MSLAPTVFKALAKARADGVTMTPRSAGDKEYFAQDWFADRLAEIGLDFEAQGRNSYPDFLVGPAGMLEGFEIKSLAFTNGKPARKDLDFNSTIPSGQKDAMDVFLVFFLYEGRGAEPRSVHTIAVAHGDLINADHAVADQHVNVKVPRFGSFGDGFIRNRKMYVFPHPATIDPSGLGEARPIPNSSRRDRSASAPPVNSSFSAGKPVVQVHLTSQLVGSISGLLASGSWSPNQPRSLRTGPVTIRQQLN